MPLCYFSLIKENGRKHGQNDELQITKETKKKKKKNNKEKLYTRIETAEESKERDEF